MHISRTMQKQLSLLLCFVTVLLGLHSAGVNAAMIRTETLITEQQSTIDKSTILAQLQNEEAKTLLLNLGVSPEQVEERVQGMTSSEIAQLNAQINEMPAGGEGLLGVVILVFLVLILLDLLGSTDIFPAIRPINTSR